MIRFHQFLSNPFHRPVRYVAISEQKLFDSVQDDEQKKNSFISEFVKT